MQMYRFGNLIIFAVSVYIDLKKAPPCEKVQMHRFGLDQCIRRSGIRRLEQTSPGCNDSNVPS